MLVFSVLFYTTTVYAATFVVDDIETDTEWTKEGNPYVITSGFSVMPEAKLTINPGVVMKAGLDTRIDIQGEFIARGTVLEPITFTSINDSPTNSEASSSQIFISQTLSRHIQLGIIGVDHLKKVIWAAENYGSFLNGSLFAGSEPVLITDPSFLPYVSNIEAIATDVPIDIFCPPPKYTGDIYTDFACAIAYARANDISMIIYTRAPKPGDWSNPIYFSSGSRGRISHMILKYGGNDFCSNNNCIIEPMILAIGSNIKISDSLFEHGFKIGITAGEGSRVDISRTIFNDVLEPTRVEGGNLSILDSAKMANPVIIVPGILGSAQRRGVWVIDPILRVYDNLIRTLTANGYTASSTLFTFPYDWRRSNIDTAKLLKERIDYIKAVCNCLRVDIIAHSMGGFVSRAYINSAEYAGDIGTLIFLGTPQYGAPEDYLIVEGGEFGTSVRDRALRSIINTYAKKQGYKSIPDFIRGLPLSSVIELLPIYNYLSDASSTPRIYPNMYPRNIFLENLDQGLARLATSTYVLNIIGNQATNTISAILVGDSGTNIWEHGKPTKITLGQGDGTVPIQSARIPKVVTLSIVAKHIDIPTAAESAIIYELLGKDKPILRNRSLPVNILIASMNSPANMVIVAPSGARAGKDFETGGEHNDIPGAFYSGPENEIEFVTISDPEEGRYIIETKGTGDGEYTVEIEHVSDATSTISSFTGTTSFGTRRNLDFTIGSTSVFDIQPIIETVDLPPSPPPPAPVLAPVLNTAPRQSSRSSSRRAVLEVVPEILVIKPQIVKTPQPEKPPLVVVARIVVASSSPPVYSNPSQMASVYIAPQGYFKKVWHLIIDWFIIGR